MGSLEQPRLELALIREAGVPRCLWVLLKEWNQQLATLAQSPWVSGPLWKCEPPQFMGLQGLVKAPCSSSAALKAFQSVKRAAPSLVNFLKG